MRENPAKRLAMRERMKDRVVSEAEEAKVVERRGALRGVIMGGGRGEGTNALSIFT